ncbi:hypothetical protein [Amycolatopsis thermoflava]
MMSPTARRIVRRYRVILFLRRVLLAWAISALIVLPLVVLAGAVI